MPQASILIRSRQVSRRGRGGGRCGQMAFVSKPSDWPGGPGSAVRFQLRITGRRNPSIWLACFTIRASSRIGIGEFLIAAPRRVSDCHPVRVLAHCALAMEAACAQFRGGSTNTWDYPRSPGFSAKSRLRHSSASPPTKSAGFGLDTSRTTALPQPSKSVF
jgi:hypothetical protein